MQVKLVDAGFIWTEPHSRRLKTKLTVQSEVFNGCTWFTYYIIQSLVLMWSRTSYFDDWCLLNVHRLYMLMHCFKQSGHTCLASLSGGRDSPSAPSAAVCAEYQSLMMQVRQHTEHKRTFMFLEQVILKYNAASTCINIKDIHEVGPCLACSANDNEGAAYK